MLKVLYLLNHAGKGGTEKYVENLIKNLKDEKIKPFFAYNEEGLLVEKLQEMGVSITNINMKHPFDIVAAKKLSDYCKKNGIDIIHTQFLRENYISLLSKIFNPKIKVVYTNHFILYNNSIVKFTNGLLTPFNSKIISVCNKGKEVMISNNVSRKNMEVVFNGIDVEYYGEPIKSTLQSEFNIDKDDFIMFCGSRFSKEKGHDFLIKALEILKKNTRTSFKCVLANDGPLYEDIRNKVKKLGLSKEVIFTGFRTDIKNLLYGSHLYVNPSENEALSFAMLEALGCEIPVVAADIGGNSDIINDSTKCGTLVKYGDKNMLAKEMKKIMDNETYLKDLKQNAKKAANEIFSMSNMIEKTYKIYQEVK
jgi:glycosyltransferase involved in cell wall biosynthesis